MDSHAHVQSARHRAPNRVVSSSQRPVLRPVCDPRPPPPLPVRGLEVTICASSRRDVDAREGGAEPDTRPMLTHAKCELQRRRNFSFIHDCSCLRGMYAGGGRRATARRCGRAGNPSIPVGRSHEAVTVTIPHPSIRKSPDVIGQSLPVFSFPLPFLDRVRLYPIAAGYDTSYSADWQCCEGGVNCTDRRLM